MQCCSGVMCVWANSFPLKKSQTQVSLVASDIKDINCPVFYALESYISCRPHCRGHRHKPMVHTEWDMLIYPTVHPNCNLTFIQKLSIYFILQGAMFTLCQKVFSASSHVFVILSFQATEGHGDENSRA